MQLLVHEDGSILVEACSNNFLEGSDRLSSRRRRRSSPSDGRNPVFPTKPNWWAVQATIHPDTKEVAQPGSRDVRGDLGLCGTEMITGRMFSSPIRGNTPTMKAAGSPGQVRDSF